MSLLSQVLFLAALLPLLWAAPLNNEDEPLVSHDILPPPQVNIFYEDEPIPSAAPNDISYPWTSMNFPASLTDTADVVTEVSQDTVDEAPSHVTGFSNATHYYLVASVCIFFLAGIVYMLGARLRNELKLCRRYPMSDELRQFQKDIGQFAVDPLNLAPVYAKIAASPEPLYEKLETIEEEAHEMVV